MSLVKRFHPVQYRDQEGTLTISSTELSFEVVSDDDAVVCVTSWPTSSIERHMIKSVSGNKHLVRLILLDSPDDAKNKPVVVILQVTARKVVEQIKAEISKVRKRCSSTSLDTNNRSSSPSNAPKSKRTTHNNDLSGSTSFPGVNTPTKKRTIKKKKYPSNEQRRASSRSSASEAQKETTTHNLIARSITSSLSTASNQFPSHWTGSPPFENKLIRISPKSQEYWNVLHKLRDTMDGPCHLSRLFRIQNEGLWSYYQFRKTQLAKKYQSYCSQGDSEEYLNERTVWHGTSSLNPAVIYEDEQDGFMMQYASQSGLWGRGIYFSERAEYSDHYAYKPQQAAGASGANCDSDADDRELLLVQLLIGQTVWLDRDEPWKKEACRQLVAPPVNPKFSNGKKYDTVSGLAEDDAKSKIHVVYENGRGYPAYLVRYYKGKRNPIKTPFKSYEDAMKGNNKNEEEPDAETTTTTTTEVRKKPKRSSTTTRQPPAASNNNNNPAPTGNSTNKNEKDSINAVVDEEQGIITSKVPDKKSSKSSDEKKNNNPSQQQEPGALAVQGMNSNAEAHNNTDNNSDDHLLVKAAIVEEDNGEDQEVVVAEHMPHIWTSPKGRKVIIGLIAGCIIVIVLVVVILTWWMLTSRNNDNETTGDSNNNTIIITGGGASNMLLTFFKNNLVLRSTINNLDNPDSPQFKAQEWLLGDPNLDQLGQRTKARRFILAAFYYATDGENWFNNTNWLDYDVDECNWFFTQNPCKKTNKGNGNFVRIRLVRNNLQGTLIPELGVMRNLQVLSLVGGLHGRIPQPMFQNLTHLELGNNRMDGSVPSELGSLNRLQDLNLSSNVGLVGTLPMDLGAAVTMTEQLQSVDLSSTSLSGEIPWCSDQLLSTELEGTELFYVC